MGFELKLFRMMNEKKILVKNVKKIIIMNILCM